jgi:hypothetical protein
MWASPLAAAGRWSCGPLGGAGLRLANENFWNEARKIVRQNSIFCANFMQALDAHA